MFSLFNFSSIFPGGQLTACAPMCGRPWFGALPSIIHFCRAHGKTFKNVRSRTFREHWAASRHRLNNIKTNLEQAFFCEIFHFCEYRHDQGFGGDRVSSKPPSLPPETTPMDAVSNPRCLITFFYNLQVNNLIESNFLSLWYSAQLLPVLHGRIKTQTNQAFSAYYRKICMQKPDGRLDDGWLNDVCNGARENMLAIGRWMRRLEG